MKKIAILTILFVALTSCKSDSDSPNLRTEMVFSKADGEVTQEFEYGETIYFEVYVINQNKLNTAVMTYGDCEGVNMSIIYGNEIVWTEEDRGIGCGAVIRELIIYPQERFKIYEGKIDYFDEETMTVVDFLLQPNTYHVEVELVDDYGGFSTKDLTILPPPETAQ
ncbi:MAG TPA: hypothetical protein VIM93_02235 [Kangiella sp.]